MAVEAATAQSLLPLLQEGKPDAGGWLARRIAMGVILAVFLLIPVLDLSWLRQNYISYGLVFVMVGISVNILMGYAGQISLGHQAFVGVGAFTSALFVTSAKVPFFFAVPLAAVTGGIAALLLGIVALRLAGLYLALITLAYGQIAERVIFSHKTLAGGAQAPRPAGFTSELSFVYLSAAVVAFLYFLDWRFVKSKAGRAIFAIRENEIAAASFGINVVAYKLMAFIFSGAVAGVAGAMFAHQTTIVVASTFSFQLALTFVLMAAVGGLGSRAGVFMGSMFFGIFPLAAAGLKLPSWFPELLREAAIGLWTLAIGALLLLVTLALNPGGIAQQLKPITDWLAGKPFSLKREHGGVQSGGAGVRP